MRDQSFFDFETVDEEPRTIALPDAELRFYEQAFSAADADAYFAQLLRETPWRHDEITLHGKTIALPRLQAWYADEHHVLNYSGMRVPPLAWTDTLSRLRERVSELAARTFNGVLVNCYRDGRDSVGWHSDNEAEWGEYPVIASLSFGATREFQLKHAFDRRCETVRIPLTHGSLLIMGETVQKFWKHQLPKRRRVFEPRINLTFRNMTHP